MVFFWVGRDPKYSLDRIIGTVGLKAHRMHQFLPMDFMCLPGGGLTTRTWPCSMYRFTALAIVNRYYCNCEPITTDQLFEIRPTLRHELERVGLLALLGMK